MAGGMYVRIIAKNAAGYAEMNSMLTELHAQEEPFFETIEPLTKLNNCIVIVPSSTFQVPFSSSVFLGIDNQHHPGDKVRVEKLVREANAIGLPVCIACDVRYANRDDYNIYDAMTCIRLGISIFDPHIERPVNDEQHLRSESELRALLPYPDAFANTQRIIDECEFDILPDHVTPPSAHLPNNTTPEALLRELCHKALPLKYERGNECHPEERGRSSVGTRHLALGTRAAQLLEHELDVICSLGLADFFLVVKEIIDEARRRNIRCSGRGSAANSIVAYLLDITGVCPIRHNLLFERFLHRGRKGTPDIDVDFDSDRRGEIIAWMEQRFGTQQTAMTATLITYRARMAVRDAAKALGFPMETVNKMSKAVPGFTNKSIDDYKHDIANASGIDVHAPLLHVLLRVVEKIADRPRHLGLHSGGMILSARPLKHFTPIQKSANGVSVVQFDKDDVEAMGLVKFDVLGLRMLACISEAIELLENSKTRELENSKTDWHLAPGTWNVLDACEGLDDPAVFDLIKSGKTLGVFQIESQGQMHLLAQHQPETFDDLVTEVALFRPGPLQGGMVNPYVRRRRGQEPVVYQHADLEPLLRDTLGIVLFQEQVLEIAHHFAGMPLDEADDFRALVSKNRDAKAMEAMHEKFVKGAMARGVDNVSAENVYETVSHFVGYGFCRSHAAAFAKIVYQSAWLKVYYPAAYMAAFMQHRPGMYNLMTLEEEAKRFGVATLLPDINISSMRYSLENAECQMPNAKLTNAECQMPNAKFNTRIRKPLTSIKGMTEDVARMIVWERARKPFTSAEDLVQRVELTSDLYDAIALSGALDSVEGDSRRALWVMGLLKNAKCRMPNAKLNGKSSSKSPRSHDTSLPRHLVTPPPISETLIPELPPIRAQERLAYDYMTHGAARVHPMTLYRRILTDLEVRTISTAWSLVPNAEGQTPNAKAAYRPTVIVAGIVILRQSPPTAHGVLFITIEDETGFAQCVVQPKEREMFSQELRNAALIVKAEVHSIRNWRGLLVREVRVLNNVIGGYHGHPAMYGGLDTMELQTETEPTPIINDEILQNHE